MDNRWILGLVAGATFLGVVAGVGWWRLQEEEPAKPIDDAAEDDTGLSRKQTEDRMREIGYVQ